MDSAVSECLANGIDGVNAIHKSLVAETIEVVPEIIPYNDSEDDDDFNDDDEDDDGDGGSNGKKFQGNFYDYNDNEQEDFDEYGTNTFAL